MFPCVYTLIIINFLIWFYSRHINKTTLSVSYDDCITKGQYYRVVTSSFTHESFWHVTINMLTLYCLAELEVHFQSHIFILLIIIIVWSEGIIMFILYHTHNKYLQLNDNHYGSSAMIFALFTIQCGLNLPNIIALFLPLIIMSLIQFSFPNASLLGHLSGITSGFILSQISLQWISHSVVYLIVICNGLFLIWNVRMTYKTTKATSRRDF